jgi:hypothetical protein
VTRDLDWLRALRRYLAVLALANAVWELAQLPLYAIWSHGTPRDKLVAVSHCTAGDILIAVNAWLFAVVVAGTPHWPAEAVRRVALLIIACGLAYTGYSEWLNATVRQSWTYSDSMPVIPGLGVGVSPMLQWLINTFFQDCNHGSALLGPDRAGGGAGSNGRGGLPDGTSGQLLLVSGPICKGRAVFLTFRGPLVERCRAPADPRRHLLLSQRLATKRRRSSLGLDNLFARKCNGGTAKFSDLGG